MTDGLRIRLVVPCYDEATRLEPDRYHAFLAGNPDVGLVLVDDGSRDGTGALLEAIAARWPHRVVVCALSENHGKAEAVRRGMVRAMEQPVPYVGYWDADLATPLSAVWDLAAVLDAHPEVDIVMGSRVALLGHRIERTTLRHYLGRLFATAASLTLDVTVYDTQCGAKLLRHGPRTRALFDEPFGSRWIFDVELLARYLAQPDLDDPERRIFEVPLRHWRDVGASKVRGGDFLRAAGELARIFRRYPLDRRWARRSARPPDPDRDPDAD